MSREGGFCRKIFLFNQCCKRGGRAAALPAGDNSCLTWRFWALVWLTTSLRTNEFIFCLGFSFCPVGRVVLVCFIKCSWKSMRERCIGAWSCLLLASLLLYTKQKCSVSRPRGRVAQSCWAVPPKNDHIFLIVSGVSGVAGLHVSCTCIPVCFSLCSRDQHTDN